jgi:diaminobutyrate-2-oxoglutarate transaminase
MPGFWMDLELMRSWTAVPSQQERRAGQEREAGPAFAGGVHQRIPLYDSFCNSYLDRQDSIESNARSYPRRLPIALKSGRGAHVWDTDGREYIDCLAGAGALALGHNHPVVTQAIRKALEEDVPLQTLDLPTPLKAQFIDELFAALPGDFAGSAKIHFCGPSGADAVEAAIKLARVATGRRSLMCFRGAYHGMTAAALSLTGDIGAKAASVAQLSDICFLPFPSDYHCPFGIGGEAGWRACANYIEALLDDPNSGVSAPAALILEVVQGEGGVNPAPDAWLKAIRAITQQRGILLIVDEVQTGLGRTGHLFAFQSSGIMPDIAVLSKAIGGGLPLSVIVYRRDIDVWQPGAHAGTFRGNQLGFAAGAATIRHIRLRQLDRHAHDMGERLTCALRDIAARFSEIGNVRGRGLMTGVEIIDPRGAVHGGGLARRIQHNCLRHGLIVELGGRFSSVVRLLPPLIVTHSQIDEIAARFEAAVRAST